MFYTINIDTEQPWTHYTYYLSYSYTFSTILTFLPNKYDRKNVVP